MKTRSLFIFALFSLCIVLSAFQCGDRYNDLCQDYVQDSFPVSLNRTAGSGVLNPYDTVKFISALGKKISSYNNTPIVLKDSLEGTFYFQAYRVTQSAGEYNLQIANIEFNYFPTLGINSGGPYNGSQFMYRKIGDSLKLAYNIVPGKQGLFVFVNNMYLRDRFYSNNIDTSNDRCRNLREIIDIPATQRRADIWDSIGMTELRVANGNYNYPVVKKSDRNYFFLRVL